jgi:hypothetical protein
MGRMNVIMNLMILKSAPSHRAGQNAKHKRDIKLRKDGERDLRTRKKREHVVDLTKMRCGRYRLYDNHELLF